MAIIKKFGDTKISFKEMDDNIWVKIADIGKALEYKNASADANQLFRRNKDELNEFASMLQFEASEFRCLNEQGVYIFCMLSDATKAKEFRRWVARTLQQLRNRKDLTVAEYLLKQAERFVELEKQGKVFGIQLDQHTEQLRTLETILLPEAKITESQAENIREAVGTIAYKYDNEHPQFGMVWGRLKTEIGFASYREIPREKYPAVMKFLDNWFQKLRNPFKE